MPDIKLTAIDSHALPWEERPNEKIGRSLYRKNPIVDPDTGMEVRLVRYPAGAVNPLHTHPCAHGMYVLEGTLATHDGQYGPGHFVWFPEGSLTVAGLLAGQRSGESPRSLRKWLDSPKKKSTPVAQAAPSNRALRPAPQKARRG